MRTPNIPPVGDGRTYLSKRYNITMRQGQGVRVGAVGQLSHARFVAEDGATADGGGGVDSQHCNLQNEGCKLRGVCVGNFGTNLVPCCLWPQDAYPSAR